MTTMRVLSVLAIVVLIFSLTHAIPPPQMVTRYIHNMFKNPRYYYKLLNTSKGIFEVLPNKNPPNSDLAFIYGFYASLAVNKQSVLAWIAINNPVTWIYNYNYTASSPNYRCCQTVDSTSCGYHPSDLTECFRQQGNYISATDLFMLDNDVNSFEINFLWSPANYAAPSWFAKGVLSFHRNSSYSLINQFQCPGFSYYFTFNETRGSRVTFGVEPNETLASRFQSVQLLENKNNQGYEDLYYVPPPEISIGSRSLQIQPTTEFYNGVIIDTSIPYILLVTSVYSKVMKELQSQIGSRRSVDTANGIICSDNTTNWPSLTLSFKSSSGYAEMVLGKNNYVVPDIYRIGSECAAIYESQNISVIGLIAQLDRNMAFDVKGSVLYFDKYPQSGLSGETKPTITFFLVMFYFILILPVLVVLAFKG